jgi:rod shape-determining protein MreC
MPSFARKRRSPNRAVAWGVGLCLGALALVALEHHLAAPLSGARSAGLGPVSLAQRFGAGLRDLTSPVWLAVFSADELRAENDALRAALAQTVAERASAESLGRALDDEVLLAGNLPRIAPETIQARVLSPVIDGRRRRLWIDRGRVDGLSEGLTVLGTHGVVGVVREVHANQALVQLMSDEGSRWGAEIAGRADAGVVAGTGRPDAFELLLEKTAADVEQGDAVVTSGRRGSTIPAGLPLAVVERVDVDPGGERRVVLAPLEQAESLRHVFVLNAPQLAWEPPR